MAYTNPKKVDFYKKMLEKHLTPINDFRVAPTFKELISLFVIHQMTSLVVYNTFGP